MTIKELNQEILHYNKEARLLEYEIDNFEPNQDMKNRYDILVQKHFDLVIAALGLDHS